MVDESAGPIEADRLLVDLEHLDEDRVIELPGVLDESAAMAIA